MSRGLWIRLLKQRTRKMLPLLRIKYLILNRGKFKISPEEDIHTISARGDKMNVTSPKMLAQAVRNTRKQRKLTQRETAESIGMKQSTVSEFENHPEGTCIGTLFKLLAALDLKLQAVSRRGEHKSSDSWDQEW
ncbi:helix-turn-helix domain-containing protein [Edwardsiella piscicida]|uniref:helix-turn-helix domain-containing protein n=2 Tax=Enterobacterales TaxID=91347 RepID=UPI002478C606|nr:helix-turn-helix domain-containing protein [Edwardsiella piscicida]WGS76715.1 XRE family transcriptional regulator [Edwardsiella piscicida]WGS80106.1 XRE family transcriptional regulator [Edwardsiella piscicida]